MDIQEEILFDMREKALEFNDFQNKYYRDEKNDEDATWMTTQPFWQSMKLSKRRMQQNGVVIQNNIPQSMQKRISKKDLYSDGRNVVGEFKRDLKINRIIYKDGKKIYSEKDENICNISVVKVEGEGSQVTCPNCGNLGEISSYIDGCDYCGAKFQVNDFDEKISGCYFEENVGRKTGNAFFKSFATSAILTILSNVLIVLAVIVLAILSATDASLKTETLVGVGVLCIALSIPVSFKIAIATLIIFAILGILILKNKKEMVENADMIEAVVPTFNKTDFIQNLEYKLRNIHMTDNVNEISAYAGCDLSETIAKYREVIDCYISKVKFTDVYRDEYNYNVELDVIMRLTKLKGKRIKYENEKLKLKMSLRKGARDVNVGSIRQYSCENCGSSVSLLEGGVCEYCGTKLDYAKYSYIISEYNVVGKCQDKYKSIKRKLLVIYVLLFLGITGHMALTNKYDVYLLLHMQEAMDYSHNCFDNLDVLENIDNNVKCIKYDKGYVDREYLYQCDDAEYSRDLYGMYAMENGYTEYVDEEGDICYAKEYRMDDAITGYHMVEMSIDNNELLIEHYIAESEDFDEEYKRAN